MDNPAPGTCARTRPPSNRPRGAYHNPHRRTQMFGLINVYIGCINILSNFWGS